MILHKTIVASCNKALSFIFFYKIASELLFIEYFNNFRSETEKKNHLTCEKLFYFVNDLEDLTDDQS